jgi:hypothetical protein
VADGGGHQVVIADKLAGGRITGAIRNAPTHQFGWAGNNLDPAFVELGGEPGGER